MTRILNIAVFLVGLGIVAWVGTGYAANPIALAVTVAIAVFYVAGAVELWRYHGATGTLDRAVGNLSGAPAKLEEWLDQLHPSLRVATRLRVEGERAALPGPALTPYLVGLLVLLGMLGTFLGMVGTLRGTGIALESAADLQAIRASLAAPVKGLGFAFGTSVAGVATSAMLGLLSAFCRRERVQAGQRLDARIATTLRVYSPAHQREESLKLLQRQAEAMPALVDRLEAMIAGLERQSQAAIQQMAAGQDALQSRTDAAHAKLAASQEAFHERTETAYARLAESFAQSLKAGVAESARAASDAIQPAVQATLAGFTRETAAWRETVAQAMTQQLDGLSARFEGSTQAVADIWKQALAEQQQAGAALTEDLRACLDRFSGTFEQRSAALLDGVSSRLDGVSGRLSQAWTQALSEQTRTGERLAGENRQALGAAVAALEQQSASLLQALDQSHAGLRADLASRDEARLAVWRDTFGEMTRSLRDEWREATAGAVSRQQEICEVLARTADEISASTKTHARETIGEIGRLVHVASEAPKAAAEVIAELRQKLSDSMVRDNAMLDERNRLLETVSTLLDAVNHAAHEQRQAVDALVATSAQLLERVGAQFTDKLDNASTAFSDKLENVEAGFGDTVERVSTRLTDNLDAVGSKFADTVQAVGMRFSDNVEAVGARFNDTVAAVGTQLSGTLESVGSRFTETVDTVGGRFTDTVESAATRFTDTVETAGSRFTDAIEGVGTQFTETVEGVGTRFTATVEGAGTRFTETVETVGARLTETVEGVGTRLTETVETVGSRYTETVEGVGTRFTDTVEAAAARFADTTEATGTRFADTTETLGMHLADAVESAGTRFGDTVQAVGAELAGTLESVGSRFSETASHEAGRLSAAAEQVAGGTNDIAALGEAFGEAVRDFGATSERLAAQLQSIETALEKSGARSDEQLAYYVAQAREVVDLSVLSQKQIIEALQDLTAQRADSGADAV
ncbi:DUF802 domain-containing protein [Bordetella genomosp. 9]|uniref:DUF802 domain-containing protein n=1 Tax=Bordetella genomosp. 9 TaxID=1416803 RepID=A0A1W6YWC0_9BORD|nr:DUF802 domain-containing protein [Bordetella genomosp. 9]ARP85405.1 hypothetical protein CAL13_03605 [Bordetella genomosp. 9]